MPTTIKKKVVTQRLMAKDTVTKIGEKKVEDTVLEVREDEEATETGIAREETIVMRVMVEVKPLNFEETFQVRNLKPLQQILPRPSRVEQTEAVSFAAEVRLR